ncbi:transglutaminase-like cysteine peptidase [Falsihalocynthiibacter sp. SS001]|uniref:transglutaminase-like cysteine peptidase n=1 Tax=Falsihalocynthiibacter sp. SS001 TaxID=3349698 RepID=UPI0036D40654
MIKRLLPTAAFALLMTAGSVAATAPQAHLVHTRNIAPPSGASALCQTYQWACTTNQQRANGSQSEAAIVQKINLYINRSVPEVSDRSQYKQTEYWAVPTALGGDCEDFALIKKRELVKRGVDPKRLLLATVLDRQRNGHAVLVYRSETGDYVLDNATNQIRPWQDTGYIFLRMQDPKRPSRWVTGFTAS